ncbi:uncharacterized protein H6S33_001538 [Morchella sextelata]|jgi:hypothetical protein|uniref:uncharacterized protein n=1 Tax=Morchella sextelata TaxID=1174677 RepID=UPI001D04B188|nr:uncharacterized protein H6S33_001538 [Morchella sextelata]KAH0608404.1 hypothetical protein H6S33_001538 [Morchella sextelata]
MSRLKEDVLASMCRNSTLSNAKALGILKESIYVGLFSLYNFRQMCTAHFHISFGYQSRCDGKPGANEYVALLYRPEDRRNITFNAKQL